MIFKMIRGILNWPKIISVPFVYYFPPTYQDDLHEFHFFWTFLSYKNETKNHTEAQFLAGSLQYYLFARLRERGVGVGGKHCTTKTL